MSRRISFSVVHFVEDRLLCALSGVYDLYAFDVSDKYSSYDTAVLQFSTQYLIVTGTRKII